jgi:hypothetical protein
MNTCRRYPDRNAIDAAAQTQDKYVFPKKGGFQLPSAKVNALDYIHAIADDELESENGLNRALHIHGSQQIEESAAMDEDEKDTAIKVDGDNNVVKYILAPY